MLLDDSEHSLPQPLPQLFFARARRLQPLFAHAANGQQRNRIEKAEQMAARVRTERANTKADGHVDCEGQPAPKNQESAQVELKKATRARKERKLK